MNDRQQMARSGANTSSVAADQDAQRIQAPGTERIYVPDVDIRDDGENIRLEANMPGVDQTSVNVGVENGVLTIEGRANLDSPQGYTLIGQEYGVGCYRRDFELSDAVDADRIKARMRQGVLEVTLPKQGRARTRRIAIET